MQRIARQRGDTIIEVMLAFTVFAMVAVGALTVMNQGTAGAQNTLETTLVRQQVDNQAEMIRYLHQAYISNPSGPDTSMSGKFRNIVAFAKSINLTEPNKYGDTCTETLPGEGSPDQRFVVKNSGDMLQESDIKAVKDLDAGAAPYAQVYTNPSTNAVTSYGLWVEPVISNAGTNTQYIDFNIRACWQGAIGSNQRTIGTIVRLYVPENIATGTGGAGGAPATPPITTPPPVAAPIEILGSSASLCYPHLDVERFESEGAPTIPPLPNTVGKDTSESDVDLRCQRPGAGQIWSCANYDAHFTPTIPAGKYKMTIVYSDAPCGAFGGNPDLTAAYKYRVETFLQGNPSLGVKNIELEYALPGQTKYSPALDMGDLAENSTIQIRWWNNHFYDGIRDPDFVILKLILEKV